MAKNKSKNAEQSKGSSRGLISGLVLVAVILVGGYTVFWHHVASITKEAYVEELSSLGDTADIIPPEISGFPGKLVLSKDRERISSERGSLDIYDLRAESWPYPDMPINITTSQIRIRSSQWLEGLQFEAFRARIRANDDRVLFEDSALKQNDFEAKLTGTVDISDPDVAIPNLMVEFSGHDDLLDVLVASGIIQDNAARFVSFGLKALTNDETQKVEVPIYVKGGMINLGPFPIMQLPKKTQDAPKRSKPAIPDLSSP